jgi:hypothetical protein
MANRTFADDAAYTLGKTYARQRKELEMEFAQCDEIGDAAAAASVIDRLAQLSVQEQAAGNLYNQHVASQQPRYAAPLTPKERAAKPIEKMDWNDMVAMTRESKYARNIRADDPNLVAGFYEAQRRRYRGE